MSESKAVNIRSFKPGREKGQELIVAIKSASEALKVVRDRADAGFFTIVNELIPLDDGGVSGVVFGDVIEFAPNDTPKCVEKPGVASLPRALGLRLLELVYGFRPDTIASRNNRVEFSLHPVQRGLRNGHTIIWEQESLPGPSRSNIGFWPNRFSEFIGDKAYGLLIAEVLGYRVPWTIAIPRNLAPFTFGRRTGTGSVWLRTCPKIPIAGKYPTVYGWQDPFKLVTEWDHEGEFVLASVLAQESARFLYSGAAQTLREQSSLVEGKVGRGDSFMVGTAGLTKIPLSVERHVKKLHKSLVSRLQSVKFEWVWDGSFVWIVQLHKREESLTRNVIVAGSPKRFIKFRSESGLEALRDLITKIQNKDVGVILKGSIGVTSHFGDLLRQAGIPSRLQSLATRVRFNHRGSKQRSLRH